MSVSVFYFQMSSLKNECSGDRHRGYEGSVPVSVGSGSSGEQLGKHCVHVFVGHEGKVHFLGKSLVGI